MRLLFIDEEFPFPPDSGKRIRTTSLARELLKHHEIHYLAYGSGESGAIAALNSRGIVCHAVVPPDRGQAGARFYARLALNLFSPLPYIVTSHFTARFQSRLSRVAGEVSPDVIICEWTPYAIFLRDVGTKSIIVAHNIESDIWRRYELNETNALRRWYIRLQRVKVERFERSCYRWAQGATTVTEDDAGRVRALGVGYEVQVVDNGVDTSLFSPGGGDVEKNSILFIGSMDWRPNQDAVMYFAKSILPCIRETRPGARFIVVGRRPPRSILDLQKEPGVRVTGTVDDTRPYLARAAVVVVPLRIGGGSRLKILEALSMKKGVVSTAVGAEGLHLCADTHLLIADSPADFAQATIRVLAKPELAQSLGDAGRRLVEKRYTWESLARKYSDYIARIAAA